MSLCLAIKAFFKAWKQPEKAKAFLEEPKQLAAQASENSHLRLLSTLQQQARLIDFFKEDLKDYSDAQIGAAVRKIHQDANKALEDYVTIRTIRSEEEGTQITIPQGYDATQIKLVGRINGEPPYRGTLVHRGWIAHKHSLPKSAFSGQSPVICPAEVEVK